VICELVEAVLKDTKKIVPVSTIPGAAYGIKDMSVGVPCVLGRGGAEKVWKVPLDANEMKKLKKSAALLKKTMRGAK